MNATWLQEILDRRERAEAKSFCLVKEIESIQQRLGIAENPDDFSRVIQLLHDWRNQRQIIILANDIIEQTAARCKSNDKDR